MTENHERRPRAKDGVGVVEDTPIVRVRTVVRVNLANHDDVDQALADRRVLTDLGHAPAGSAVVVHVGDREFVTDDAVAMLRWSATTHWVDIEGSSSAVARWRDAVTTGQVIR